MKTVFLPFDIVVMKTAAEAWDPCADVVTTVSAGTRGTLVEIVDPGEWLLVECEGGIVEIRRDDVDKA